MQRSDSAKRVSPQSVGICERANGRLGRCWVHDCISKRSTGCDLGPSTRREKRGGTRKASSDASSDLFCYPRRMLDQIKMLSALSGVMKNKDKLAGAADRVKDRLASVRCHGEAGGGAVKVTVSGKMEVLSVQIAPALANGMATDNATRERAGGLIAEATNIAIAQAQQSLKDSIEREAKELGLEGIPDIAGLGKMLGGR